MQSRHEKPPLELGGLSWSSCPQETVADMKSNIELPLPCSGFVQSLYHLPVHQLVNGRVHRQLAIYLFFLLEF